MRALCGTERHETEPKIRPTTQPTTQQGRIPACPPQKNQGVWRTTRMCSQCWERRRWGIGPVPTSGPHTNRSCTERLQSTCSGGGSSIAMLVRHKKKKKKVVVRIGVLVGVGNVAGHGQHTALDAFEPGYVRLLARGQHRRHRVEVVSVVEEMVVVAAAPKLGLLAARAWNKVGSTMITGGCARNVQRSEAARRSK